MLHRLIVRIASLALVAGLLAVPAAADAKHHPTRKHARHHLVKKTRSVVKSAGRVEGGTIGEPTHNELETSPRPPNRRTRTRRPSIRRRSPLRRRRRSSSPRTPASSRPTARAC